MSCLRAHGQTQARQQKLAVLGVPEGYRPRHDKGGDGAQSSDDLPCVLKPTHMRVAGGEKAVGLRTGRILLDREEQLWHGLIEAPADEMRDAYCKERPADAGVVFATEDRPALTLKPKGGRLGLVSGKPARHPGDRRDHR